MKKVILLAFILISPYLYSFGEAPAVKTVKSPSSGKSEVIVLTKAEFLKRVENFEKNPKEWTYIGDKPCIIDFYATWCGPCKRTAPIMEELATEYKGKIYFYKVDTDKETELAQTFGIRSIPTLLFCPLNGNPSMAQGAIEKAEFIKIINQSLIKKSPNKENKKIAKTTSK